MLLNWRVVCRVREKLSQSLFQNFGPEQDEEFPVTETRKAAIQKEFNFWPCWDWDDYEICKGIQQLDRCMPECEVQVRNLNRNLRTIWKHLLGIQTHEIRGSHEASKGRDRKEDQEMFRSWKATCKHDWKRANRDVERKAGETNILGSKWRKHIKGRERFKN